jgi:Ca2+-transporting ATPase
MLLAFVIGAVTGLYKIVPLVALQILVVNLVTDGLPALALAVDPGEPGIMQRPPRDPKKSIFDRSMVSWILGMGFWIMFVTLGVFVWALNSGRSPIEAQCLCFAALITEELFRCFECRSERYSIFRIGLFSNRWLVAAVASSFAITLAIIYLPFLQGPFHTCTMGLKDWGIIILAGASVVVVAEIAKLVMARRPILPST